MPRVSTLNRKYQVFKIKLNPFSSSWKTFSQKQNRSNLLLEPVTHMITNNKKKNND